MYNVLLQRKVKIECVCIMYNGIIVTVNKSDPISMSIIVVSLHAMVVFRTQYIVLFIFIDERVNVS